jgi:hypothetical protein
LALDLNTLLKMLQDNRFHALSFIYDALAGNCFLICLIKADAS